MAKLILSDVGSLVNHESARETINNNFTEIEQAVDELLSRDGTTPNQMTADLDMNSKKVMNMADGVADADGVNIRVARRIAADAGSGDTSIRQDLAQVGTGKGTELVAYTPPSTGVLGTVKGFLDSLWSTGASAGAALIRWIQNDPGAVSRTVQDKLRETLSVKDFGAVGDGTTDDTVAINNALTAAAAIGNSRLFFPTGTYLYQGNGWLDTGVTIEGEGRNSTIIKSALASPTGGYLFRCAGYGTGLSKIRFEAAVAQTAGSYVWLSGPETYIEDFYMTGDFNGVLMTGNVSRIRHGRFQDGATNAIRIRAEGGDNSQVIDDVLMGAQSPQVSAAGIRVRNSSALMITNTSVITQGNGLLIDPFSSTLGTSTANTDSGNVFSLYVDNCFFDNNSGNGIRIVPTGDASVLRCRFSNVWASSSTGDGVVISNSSTGSLSGMHFESPHIMLNGGAGMTLAGVVSDVAVVGGEVCQNSYGFYINSPVTNFKVTSATIGAGAGLTGNTNYGIFFDPGAAASDYVLISNNVMQGNSAGALSVSAVTGANKTVYGNIGDTPSTWTPTITFDTPGDLAVTYSTQAGSWTRVGNVVVASYVIATSAFTHTTAAGNLRIAGLPFVATAATQVNEGPLEFQGITKSGFSNFTTNLVGGNSYMNVRASNSAAAISNVAAADMPTGGSVVFRGTITYFV